MTDLEFRRLVRTISLLAGAGWPSDVCVALYCRYCYLATHGGAE